MNVSICKNFIFLPIIVTILYLVLIKKLINIFQNSNHKKNDN